MALWKVKMDVRQSQRCSRWLLDLDHWLPTETGKMLHYSEVPRDRTEASKEQLRVDELLTELIDVITGISRTYDYYYSDRALMELSRIRRQRRSVNLGYSVCGQRVLIRFDPAGLPAKAQPCGRCLSSPRRQHRPG